VSAPERRLSETLVEFGRPVLSSLPDPASHEQLEAALGVIVTLWNALVLAEPAWGQPEDLARLVTLRDSAYLPEPMSSAVASLSERRAAAHRGDVRLVTRWVLSHGVDGDALHCEVALPPGAVGA
jgi:hypothetical protein